MFNKKYKDEMSIVEKTGINIVILSSLLSVIPFGYIVWSLLSNLLGEWKFVIGIIIIIYQIVIIIGAIKISEVFHKKYNQFNEEIDDD